MRFLRNGWLSKWHGFGMINDSILVYGNMMMVWLDVIPR